MKLYKKINMTLIHIVKITILSDHRTLSADEIERERKSEIRRKRERWCTVGEQEGRGQEMELVEVGGRCER